MPLTAPGETRRLHNFFTSDMPLQESMLSQKVPRNLKSERKYPLYWCGVHEESAEVYEKINIFFSDYYAS